MNYEERPWDVCIEDYLERKFADYKAYFEERGYSEETAEESAAKCLDRFMKEHRYG